jgi:hypothetical protein
MLNKNKNSPVAHEASCWKVQRSGFIRNAANIPFSLTLGAGGCVLKVASLLTFDAMREAYRSETKQPLPDR